MSRNKKKRNKTYKEGVAERATMSWGGLQQLTSLLTRCDGVIVSKDTGTIIKEDVVALQMANTFKL